MGYLEARQRQETTAIGTPAERWDRRSRLACLEEDDLGLCRCGRDIWCGRVGSLRSVCGWVISDVDELTLEVVFVSNAVFVITAVPDFSWGLLAGCEGVSTFDVLNALCG